MYYIVNTGWGYGVYKGSMLQMEFETETEAMQYIVSQSEKEEMP